MKSKLLFCVIFLTASFSLFSYDYQKVIEAKGKTKAEILLSVNKWINGATKPNKMTATFQDPESGTITGDGLFNKLIYGSFTFALTVEAKDEKVRITFSSIDLAKSGSASDFLLSINDKKYNQFCSIADDELSRLKYFLKTESNSDW